MAVGWRIANWMERRCTERARKIPIQLKTSLRASISANAVISARRRGRLSGQNPHLDAVMNPLASCGGGGGRCLTRSLLK